MNKFAAKVLCRVPTLYYGTVMTTTEETTATAKEEQRVLKKLLCSLKKLNRDLWDQIFAQGEKCGKEKGRQTPFLRNS